MNATIYYMRSDSLTASDRRTSGTVGSISVPQREALRVAREIERFGGAKVGARGALSGHGVTVVYASGRRRSVRGWN